jgi:hypothetical protein
MRRPSKKLTIAVAAAGIIAVGGATALAYWTNSGSGSGTATTGTNASITVNQNGFAAADALYPGGPAVPLSGTFNNTNAGAVHVTSVSATSPVTVDAAHAGAGCLAADYVLGGTAPVNADVAPGSPSGAWSGLTVRLNESGINQDACKGATITIAYTSN